MKKLILVSLFALLGVALVSSSCNKLKELAKVNFDLENADGEFVIPIIARTGDVSVNAADIYLNLDSVIKAQNSQVGAKNIKEVHIKSCELMLKNSDAASNFSALESCNLEISSNVKADWVKVAGVDSNPDTESSTLSLNPNNSLELKDYFLSATQFSYRISAKARKTTSKELQCKAIVKYTIVAGL